MFHRETRAPNARATDGRSAPVCAYFNVTERVAEPPGLLFTTTLRGFVGATNPGPAGVESITTTSGVCCALMSREGADEVKDTMQQSRTGPRKYME